ncbi:hypothetical protein WISP_20087 [Willisornis vidua]|uniref:Uncharacterized protein n=1 Tax=Willisornis vidua TaxID=1566151 RepID=A0ABQ9DTZ7_9PASS|nr:hypothetical protein WISP_20087 [Willisornis vidua]
METQLMRPRAAGPLVLHTQSLAASGIQWHLHVGPLGSDSKTMDPEASNLSQVLAGNVDNRSKDEECVFVRYYEHNFEVDEKSSLTFKELCKTFDGDRIPQVGVSCAGSRVGLEDLCGSLPTQEILWFYNAEFKSTSGAIFFPPQPRKTIQLYLQLDPYPHMMSIVLATLVLVGQKMLMKPKALVTDQLQYFLCVVVPTIDYFSPELFENASKLNK